MPRSYERLALSPSVAWRKSIVFPLAIRKAHGLEEQAVPRKPEEWLEVASPSEKTKGNFKLFLGYAPGVGKTFSMLSEAIRRHSRGEDVVIGVIESHGRKATGELAAQLETVPRKKLPYKGTTFEEMD